MRFYFTPLEFQFFLFHQAVVQNNILNIFLLAHRPPAWYLMLKRQIRLSSSLVKIEWLVKLTVAVWTMTLIKVCFDNPIFQLE